MNERDLSRTLNNIQSINQEDIPKTKNNTSGKWPVEGVYVMYSECY